ncbi:DUF3107 domain-containing protein [Solicola sp. PLA-1-18]|uniref:DUF3107 domain-containing protein n=1 Tax=Solicola sp. PLA-1-18 TaxID=3380532 RepID=UPI003B75ED88
MDVRIGVQNAAREMTVDAELDRDAIVEALRAAIADEGLLVIKDKKGGSVVVPAEKIAYLEFGADNGRTVGFGG